MVLGYMPSIWVLGPLGLPLAPIEGLTKALSVVGLPKDLTVARRVLRSCLPGNS